MQGTILQGIGGFYTIMDASAECYTLRAQRKLRRVSKPKVGDRVEFEPGTGEEDGWICAIQPRRNELERPPVANIDRVVVVASVGAPVADMLLVDRMLVTARRRGIAPALVVSKCELDPGLAEDIVHQYRGADMPVLAVSAVTGEGLGELRGLLAGSVHALAGQSGAGKSSLINALYGLRLDTGELSERIERGKNTTRSCRLIPLDDGNGMVLDTPGFSLLEGELFDPVELKLSYPEFEKYEGRCYFQPCCHASEPRCAVRDAVAAGEIDPARYSRYVELLNDMRERWKARYS